MWCRAVGWRTGEILLCVCEPFWSARGGRQLTVGYKRATHFPMRPAIGAAKPRYERRHSSSFLKAQATLGVRRVRL